MGFNKKIVGKSIIEQIIKKPSNVELYLRADSLIFEDDETQKKFEELNDKIEMLNEFYNLFSFHHK